MLKIPQAKLQQYVTVNFLMFKLVLEKAEESEIKLPTSAGSWKAREFQKNIYFCFIDYAKDFDYVDHNKLWKILKKMGIPDHLICLLINIEGSLGCPLRGEELPERLLSSGPSWGR